MSLTKQVYDDLHRFPERRPDPLEDVYYGEEWPSEEEVRADADSERYSRESLSEKGERTSG